MSDEDQIVMVYPDATCPKCGSEAAYRIPATRAGKTHDFIVCHACGEVSLVTGNHE